MSLREQFFFLFYLSTLLKEDFPILDTTDLWILTLWERAVPCKDVVGKVSKVDKM